MGNRQFRFGVSLAGSPGRAELKELLARAEDFGFSVALTADHLTERHAVLPLLAVIAEMSSLRVSPMVLANDYRHPVVTALVGSRDQIMHAIEERRESLGISYVIFSSLVLDDVGPIVAGLV